jgi:TIR domain
MDRATVELKEDSKVFDMDTSLPALTDRDVVFVSHANPEDNSFAGWLTLRLTRAGYRVWCDVANLLGGDDFWTDIEAVIRLRTRKFIFVVSRHANHKHGPLQELAVASGVARQLNNSGFIVPVKVDDLPYAEHNIQIHRLNALRFTSGWAEGLNSLLQTLDDDGVPRLQRNGPQKVALWWNRNRMNHAIIQRRQERLWTNWFPLKGLPSHIWVSDIPDDVPPLEGLKYPTHRVGRQLLSFASARDLRLPARCAARRLRLELRRDPPRRIGLKRHEVTGAVKQLVRVAWEKMAERRGLPLFELSGRRRTLWFPPGVDRDANTVAFMGVDGKNTRRDLSGYRTMTRVGGDRYKRYWHFGLEAVAVLYPSPMIALKSHVVFTLDGRDVVGDAKAQHRARRSQCALWWNDKWRDLTLAAVTRLANGATGIPLVVAPSTKILVQRLPLRCRSSVSYDDVDVRPPSPEIGRDDPLGDDEDAEESETTNP